MTEDGEMELFEAQISNKVMTLGWIHTHPQFVSHFDALRVFLGFISVKC